MSATMKASWLAIAAVLAIYGAVGAENAPSKVKIKAWKTDPVELCAGTDGKVVASKPASAMPMEAERVGPGWLKVSVGGKSYFVESSQARTDLKLTG
jgi:hypothetical protein